MNWFLTQAKISQQAERKIRQDFYYTKMRGSASQLYFVGIIAFAKSQYCFLEQMPIYENLPLYTLDDAAVEKKFSRKEIQRRYPMLRSTLNTDRNTSVSWNAERVFNKCVIKSAFFIHT